jgi:GH24 family phage-related lysozyme (muramidase)
MINNHTASVTSNTTEQVDLIGMINEVNTGLTGKVNQEAIELHVGANQKYKTISSAVADWIDAYNRSYVVIFVHAGDYKEQIRPVGDGKLSIIGLDKNNTRLWWNSGIYGEEPLRIYDGYKYVANMTIENVEDTNGNRNCYAVHVDRSESDGVTYTPSQILFENCNILSHNFDGVGLGTENDEHITFKNCYLYSDKANALLYHTSIVNYTNQKLTLDNCILYSTANSAAYIKNNTPNKQGSSIEVINCNFISDAPSDMNENNLANWETSVSLTQNSYGNNVKKLNYNSTITVLDANNITLSECQIDSLISMAYNIGQNSLINSTLFKNILNGVTDENTIRSNFEAWSKCNGVVWQGLKKRRDSEADLYLNGDYTGNN